MAGDDGPKPTKSTTYLEDVQSDPSKKRKGEPATGNSPQKDSSKRQRTLVDMFGGGGNALKKAKTTAATSVVTKKAGLQRLNSIPFSLSGFKESLTDEQRKLLALECETLGKSWLKVLADEIKKPYFLKLKTFLASQGIHGVNDSAKNLKVYPAPKDIYAWSTTPLGKVKVVIIGQDPYHGPGQAHGLCFSVPHGVPPPPSLKNIYSEIKSEYPQFTPPKHGNLTAWAQNGVLMLNTCLTVQAGQAGSHSKKGWEEFTDEIVNVVDKYGGANLPADSPDNAGYGRGIVWLVWGAWAAKRVAKLDKKKHLILSSAHPSPLSARKGFLGNGHFKKANDWLNEKYGPNGMVDWCNLDIKESPADAEATQNETETQPSTSS